MSERVKILVLIISLPALIALGFWSDYTYRKAIVKQAIQEMEDEATVQPSKNP